MDQGRAYVITVAITIVAAVIASALSAAIREHRTRHSVFALIRADLAEVRAGRAHLPLTPSGSCNSRSPGQEPDGPQHTEPVQTGPPRRVRCVGLAVTPTTVSPTPRKAA